MEITCVLGTPAPATPNEFWRTEMTRADTLRIAAVDDPTSARHLMRVVADLSATGLDALCRGVDSGNVKIIQPEGRGHGLGHHAAAHRFASRGKDLVDTHRTHVDRLGLFPSEQLCVEGERRLAIGGS
jgi:hypothetical protein